MKQSKNKTKQTKNKGDDVKALTAKATSHQKVLSELRTELHKTVIGQEEVIDKLLVALLCEGHVLLEGVPGLAKTLMVKSLSETLHLSFKRVQFTPDLLPADLLGTTIYEHKSSTFSVKKGPLFHHFILADEINRAPPKVQSALLEAMQEQQITIGEETFSLERPFMVLATQNPLETEGTYVLPEAQVDRFLFKILVKYPSKEQEKEIINRYTGKKVESIKKIMSAKELSSLQAFVKTLYADEQVVSYVADLIDATRTPEEYGLKISHLLDYGASPRASIGLILAGKAHALLQGRGYVIPEDIKAIAHDVLRHRVITSYEAEAEGISSDEVIDKILSSVKVP